MNHDNLISPRLWAVTAFTGILAVSSASAATSSWSAASGDWETAANWDTTFAPLDPSNPAGAIVPPAQTNITNIGVSGADSSATHVTVNDVLGSANESYVMTVNVNSGASLTLVNGSSLLSNGSFLNLDVNTWGSGDTSFNINSGATGAFRTIQIGRYGNSALTSSAKIVVDGGALTSQLATALGWNSSANGALLDIKNGATFSTYASSITGTNAVGSALREIRISGGSTATLSGNNKFNLVNATATNDVNAQISIIGSNNTVTVKDLELLHDEATTGTHSMVMSFTADAAGLDTLAAANIDLDSDAWVTLEVDVSADASGLGSFDLFTYSGTLAGQFGAIVATGASGALTLASASDNVQAGEYWIDYGAGSADDITFTYTDIPEASSYALIAGLLGLSCVMVRCRR
jgi:hypothetical protein